MAFAKFQENRFRIDGEIAENHAIRVNLTASIVVKYFTCKKYVTPDPRWVPVCFNKQVKADRRL